LKRSFGVIDEKENRDVKQKRGEVGRLHRFGVEHLATTTPLPAQRRRRRSGAQQSPTRRPSSTDRDDR